MCIHCLGHFSLLPSPLPFPVHNSHFSAEPVLEEKTRHNKKDKAFLLVEKRIAIQRDS
jgi:hypothetical protein